jgi:predicted GTPase
MRRNILIMGAAGKDFHVFNTCYRDQDDVHVAAFTATQIPHIEERLYPTELAGKNYPNGIPIYSEDKLTQLIQDLQIQEVVFAYSDVSHEYVEGKAKQVREAGAEFSTFDVDQTMLTSKLPVIAVCAVRTGCGKSPTTRRVMNALKELGHNPVALRHPMPYGDLSKQIVQRFATLEDLRQHDCTIEEMEEYEPIIRQGQVVYAGVDYAKILAEAEKEADVIIWDGGNNDTPFLKPDLWITVCDPLRAGHELRYFPGTTNFERADVLLINKIDQADKADIEAIEANAKQLNPDAQVVHSECRITVDHPDQIRGKKVLVVEDGPTLTHGEMKIGAGIVAARREGASDIVDPRPWAVGEIHETFEKYPDLGTLLPAMGYGEAQVRDLERTINSTECETVVVGTPIDLSRILKMNKPAVRVRYEVHEVSKPDLKELLKKPVSQPRSGVLA